MRPRLFLLSGSRESNPDHTVPNRVHYHYATPRARNQMGACSHLCSERRGESFCLHPRTSVCLMPVKAFAYTLGILFFFFTFKLSDHLSLKSAKYTTSSHKMRVLLPHQGHQFPDGVYIPRRHVPIHLRTNKTLLHIAFVLFGALYPPHHCFRDKQRFIHTCDQWHGF